MSKVIGRSEGLETTRREEDQPMGILAKARSSVEARGLNPRILESDFQAGGVTTDSLEIVDLFRAWSAEVAGVPVAEIRVGGNFSTRQALESIYCQATSQRRIFEQEPYLSFVEAMGERSFNMILLIEEHVGFVPANREINSFADFVRSQISQRNIRVVAYSAGGSAAIPGEIGRNLAYRPATKV